MADDVDDAEKTEDPSERKLLEARRKGDVAKSQEVSTWFVLVGSAMALFIFGGAAAQDLALYLKGIFQHADQIGLDTLSLRVLGRDIALAVTAALAIPLLLLIIAAIAGNAIQHGFLLSAENLKPKLSKISPQAGFKRLFSSQSLVNFAKGLAKLTIVGVLMGVVVWPERGRLDTLVAAGIPAILETASWLGMKLMIATIAVMTLIAAADFAYQRHTYYKKQRMTQREVKDEYKQAEGDPLVKAKLRQIRAERSRQRMMSKVPEATVVVTNPTHFAVALKYEEGMQAPICLAKGVDAVALRIREKAREHGVPIVENPPLARALHASVDLDQIIDPQHYKAVAQVISFVMRQNRKQSWRA
ncbi:MAG: flagellar biosynthesis protein FlhB [Rhodobiaceae bacterium]|nr:flagellar biosynthesis protein FlhB [Rhodobiaceae bacterium]MCC0012209.1 flagellar biosynthesis protein FlhB [Rhodobiaceae bacterium]MCC0050935.1 flagellar biosynthesis protein FlhB [Rhodobiaceae bacterium]MCC0060876.1 flagellar biosynthesis protein FlhB [Rhodobiaceae bacterium]